MGHCKSHVVLKEVKSLCNHGNVNPLSDKFILHKFVESQCPL